MSSTPIYTPFFYILRDTSDQRRYAGSRTGTRLDSKSRPACPDQLLDTYFTSSNIVKQRLKNGHKFVIESVIPFHTRDETLAYEQSFLQQHNCARDDNWLNAHDGQTLSPFGSATYKELLATQRGRYDYNPMHDKTISGSIAEGLKGAINCWDNQLQCVRRVPTTDYHADRDRFWHVQSKQYRQRILGECIQTANKHCKPLWCVFDHNNNTIIENDSRGLHTIAEENGWSYNTLYHTWYTGECVPSGPLKGWYAAKKVRVWRVYDRDGNQQVESYHLPDEYPVKIFKDAARRYGGLATIKMKPHSVQKYGDFNGWVVQYTYVLMAERNS